MILRTAQRGQASGNFRIAPIRRETVLDKHRVEEIADGAHGLRPHARIRITFCDLEERFVITRVCEYPDDVEPSQGTHSSESPLKLNYTGASTSLDLRLGLDSCVITFGIQSRCWIALFTFILNA